MTSVTLAIPAAIQAGLDSGSLVRWGGTIRDTAGLIVTYLDDAPVTPGFVETLLERSAAAVKLVPAKPAMIIGGAIFAVGAVAGGVAIVAKRIQENKAPEPECVATYNTSLSRYLKAVRDGDLDADIVGRLIADLDAVRAYADGNGRRIKLDFRDKQGQALLELVAEYTTKLAEANSRDLAQLLEQERVKEPSEPQESGNDAVEDLRRNLAVQMKIFCDAAEFF